MINDLDEKKFLDYIHDDYNSSSDARSSEPLRALLEARIIGMPSPIERIYLGLSEIAR